MLKQELKNRGVPDILLSENGQSVISQEQWPARRKELIDILCREEYGFMPPAPVKTEAEILKTEPDFCAGKVTLTRVLLKSTLNRGEFSFPVYCAVPNSPAQCPAFIHINFRGCVPDRYMPTEEICDNGFAVISFNYEDVAADCDDHFSTGLARVLYNGGERAADGCGKIALWAWAVSRAMDYVQTLENIDKKNIAVVGHSRLGKTALLAGGLDERFSHVISNDSGCSGAAITRGKTGESVEDICGRFPYWFCENYSRYRNNEAALPFDQHYLLALAAPRRLYVASAGQDSWADPVSEYLGCVAADEVWKLLGCRGFIHPEKLPQTGDSFTDGDIGYHIRPGSHYLSRLDWRYYMDFMKKTFVK